MCQLAAYIGDRPIASLLLRAIEHQEPYLGAHASGLGVLDDGVLKIEKDFGHVRRVMNTTSIASLKGTTGIAHSRYNAKAREDPRYNTVGMAHPFMDDSGSIALMHNGGISNYKDHWEKLKDSHTFRSYSAEVDAITDSEVAVHMLSDALKEGLSMDEALKSVASQLTGSFLLGVISEDHPETVWIANWHQPCVVALGEDEAMFCSSHIGFHDVKDEFTRMFEPPKNSLIKLTRGKAEISPLDVTRTIPFYNFNANALASRILELLDKSEVLDVVLLRRALGKDGFDKGLGVTQEKIVEYNKMGLSLVNPFFKVLDMMVADGMIEETVDFRLEGGVPDTPRFSYSLLK